MNPLTFTIYFSTKTHKPYTTLLYNETQCLITWTSLGFYHVKKLEERKEQI